MVVDKLHHLIAKFVTLLFITSYCFAEFKIIELDQILDHNAPFHVVPGTIPFTYEVIEAGYTRGFWLAFGKYTSKVHIGTHVLAPYTYYEHGITIDQIPPEQYFGEAAVIDIRSKVNKNPLYELSEQDVKEWVKTNGVFSNHSFILVNTGWEKGRYSNQKAYIGDDRGQIANIIFPGVSMGAMKAILDYEKKNGIYIIGFGIDAADFDIGNRKYEVSALVGSLEKYLIINMRNLESLPTRGARLMVTPIKIKNASAGQARVLARLPY